MHLDDPLTLPSLRTSDEDARPTRMRMSLFLVEVPYQATLDPAIDPGPSSAWMKVEDILAPPSWEVAYSCSHDFLDRNFPSDEVILEAMNVLKNP